MHDWRNMIKKELNPKSIISVIIKICLIFIAVLTFVLFFKENIYIFKAILHLQRQECSISSIMEHENGIEVTADGGYITTNDDPWFVVELSNDRVLDIELEFVDGDGSTGYIYYRQFGEDFSEEKKIEYNFVSGHNTLRFKEKMSEIRLDITNREGVKFYIKSMKKSSILFELLRQYWMLSLLISVILFLAVSMMKYASKLEKGEKKDKVTRAVFYLIILVTVVFIYGDFLTGSAYFMYNDVGSDTYLQYYPYYINCAMRIKEGTFGIWNWNYGLGTSILNSIFWTLDPFGIVVILGGAIAGLGMIKYLLVVVQIIKIIISFGLCRYLLRSFSMSEQAACLGAYLYGFNGYLMLWGQHYFLGTSSVYVLLIIVCIEKFVRTRRQRWLVFLSLAVGSSLLYSYYNTYMILVFAALYFLTRVFMPSEVPGWKNKIVLMSKCLFAAVTGIMISGIVLIPAAYYITTSSSRLESSVSIGEKLINSFVSGFSFDIIGAKLSRLISNNLLFINQMRADDWTNYYEMPNICFTIFIFLIMGLFIGWVLQQEKRKKYYYLFLVVIMIFLIMSQGCALVFNGFAYPSYRYTFVIFPVMAILVAVVWDKCIIAANINIGGLVAGSLISFVVLGYSYVNATMEVRRYSLLYGILIFIFGTLATYIWKKKVTSHRCLIMLLVLVVVSSMIDGHITNNQRSIVYRSNDTLEFRNGELANNTAKALKYIESIDGSFYRVEKTYADWVGIGDALIEGYSAVTCYNSTLNRNLADYYNILYENSNIDQSIKVFTIKNASDVQAISLVNVKYILSKEKLDYEWCKLIGQEGDVLIYRNMNTESIAKWFTNTISKEEYVGLTEEEKETVLYNKLIVENADEIHYIGNKDYRLSDFKLVNQNTVLGKINSSSEGMLLLSIPDQQGWNIYVDGELVKTYNADYGFIGVKLEAGEHEIIARYTIPYWKEGTIVSIVGVLFLILMVVFPGIKRVIIKNKDKYKGEQL